MASWDQTVRITKEGQATAAPLLVQSQTTGEFVGVVSQIVGLDKKNQFAVLSLTDVATSPAEHDRLLREWMQLPAIGLLGGDPWKGLSAGKGIG